MKLSRVTLCEKRYYTFYVESENDDERIVVRFHCMSHADLTEIVDRVDWAGSCDQVCPPLTPEGIIEVTNFETETDKPDGFEGNMFRVVLRADGSHDFGASGENKKEKP